MFRINNFLLLILIAAVISSCGPKPNKLYSKLSAQDKGNHFYKGHFKADLKKDFNKFKQVGIASWYGAKDGFHGKTTANGDKYNKNMLTAAHPTLPMPSLIKVTNLANNKSVVLMVNDRGPYSKNRILDVSEKAAHKLDFKHQGTAKVKIQYLEAESKELLTQLSLKNKVGSKAIKKLVKSRCTVNCHIKLVNLKHNITVD